ncbi:MAG: class II glutamine amidotransferase [Paracoccaceae bacterium]
MCRWAAYIGPEIFLEEIVTRPAHSLISQSLHADEGKTDTNGDGFGMAWYGAHPEPGLFRDTYPAWSDPNLLSLARQVKSGLFLAHVRASTGSATSRNNCHPFVHQNWSFMHNGMMGGYDRYRKSVDQMVADALYADRKGATDSEAAFLIALGDGLHIDPKSAMERTVYRLEKLAEKHAQTPFMRFTAAFSDGKRLYAIRYASDRFAPSLYLRKPCKFNGHTLVSEPLDMGDMDWEEVPPATFVSVENATVKMSTFTPHP